MSSEAGYAQARDRQLAVLERGLDLGTQGQISWTRDELHERREKQPAQNKPRRGGSV